RPDPRHRACSAQAAAGGAELVLVVIGPITDSQDEVIREALRLAAELPFRLDAALATTPQHAAGIVGGADEVTIVARGRERRRLERTLGPRKRPDDQHNPGERRLASPSPRG